MTIQEMGAIMDVLTVAYPTYYKKSTDEERFMACQLWAQMFAGDSAEVVAAAVKSFIATDDKGFPPAIGQIKAQIANIVAGDTMSELEAWGQVKKALRNSAYGAQKEFDRLDPAVQRIVGAPSQLREWSQIDIDTLDSVVASNFQRSYRAIASKQREYTSLPPSVMAVLAEASQACKFPELEARHG